MSEAAVDFDHVVILLPYSDILNPPEWITTLFHVSLGGRHGDGKTENRLILMKDGVYLELIAFVDDKPEHRKDHFWDKRNGVIDYAFTTSASYDFNALRERLKESGSDISYSAPKAGQRKRPDGEELKWRVVIPSGVGRGEVPFWCLDVTPRERRVPVTEANTQHPCGAVGVGGMLLEVGREEFRRLGGAISTIVNHGDNAVGTPLGDGKATIRVKETAELGEEYRLSVVLRVSGKDVPADIHQKVGDGVVSMLFEAAE